MPSTDFTISDVFPVAEFCAWVLTKPADEGYSFIDAAVCALGQFRRETMGLTALECYANDPLDDAAFDPALARALCDSATFGALATRLEALEPKSAWTRSDAYMNDLELVRA